MKATFIFDPDAPPTPACHAPTIAALGDDLIAAWFAGSHEKHPDVGIWTAVRRGGLWGEPQQVADGWGEACWNPVLHADANGIHLFYKVGPSPSQWRGALIQSGNGRDWREPRELPAPFLGPVKNKPLVLADGRLLCPSSREAGGWRSHMEVFDRNLAPVYEVPIRDPLGLRAIQPTVYVKGNGLEALMRTRSGVLGITRASRDGRWSPLARASLPNPNSGIDAATLPDGTVALVYNPVATPNGAWGGPRTPLKLAVSRSGGDEWQDVCTFDAAAAGRDDPGVTEQEFSYPAIIYSDGFLQIVYTWNRRSIKHVEMPLAEIAGDLCARDGYTPSSTLMRGG